MATVYLDVDDEITSVAARIRQVADPRIAIVVPAGSRLATSRINFRLLAREATERSRSLIVVTPDAAVRSLAAAAGLQAYATVGAYEDAEVERVAAERVAAERDAARRDAGAPGLPVAPTAAGAASATSLRGGAKPRSPGDPSAEGPTLWEDDASAPGSTVKVAPAYDPLPARAAASTLAGRATGPVIAPGASVGPRSLGGASSAGRPPDPARTSGLPVVGGTRSRQGGPPRRRRWMWLGVVALIVLALAATGAAVAYSSLPTATITIRPATEPLGPTSVVVRADPDATSVAPVAAVIPATLVEIPVEVSDTFEATGKRVEQKKATGSVTFISKDPTRSNSIPAGSIVRTDGGVGFATRASITIPKAKIEGLTILPGTADVAVVAVKGGPEANVAANTIRIVPAAEDPVLLEVRNRASTAGGTRKSFPKVTQEDVDGAVKTLQRRLDARFKDAVADPGRVPDGMEVVAGTELLGPSAATPDPESLVDAEVEAFDLTLSATGTITAFAPGDAETVAAARLATTVPAGYTLVDGSTKVQVGEATPDGTAAEVDTTATGAMIRTIDAEAVRATAKGKSPADAERVLSTLGEVTIVTWPAFLPAITDAIDRIEVRVEPSAGGPRATPAAAPSRSGTPAP
jgi:hypothetical protein